jgi:hypothetical protein
MVEYLYAGIVTILLLCSALSAVISAASVPVYVLADALS